MTLTEPRRERPRLLLIEDHKAMRAALSHLFHLSGFDVVECRDLAEGYACLSTRHGSYDAAVVDLFLPDGNGVEIVRDIRRIHGARRLVVYTACDRGPGLVDGVLDAGADAIVFKSTDFSTVLLPVVRGADSLDGADPDSVVFRQSKGA